MVAKKKVKEIKLPMKFNPGMGKYELILPPRKGNPNMKLDWKGLIRAIILIIIIILILGGLMLILKSYLPFP